MSEVIEAPSITARIEAIAARTYRDLRCPGCGSTRPKVVLETNHVRSGIRRRYVCPCHHRFTTRERIAR